MHKSKKIMVTAIFASDETFALSREVSEDLTDDQIVSYMCKEAQLPSRDLYEVLTYRNADTEWDAPSVRTLSNVR